MLWQVTIALTRGRPGRDEPQPGRGSYWMKESVFCTPRLDLDRIRATGRPVPQPIESVGQSLDQLNLLALKTYHFQFLSFLTLRQGLYVK